jgi:hypothetical protein
MLLNTEWKVTQLEIECTRELTYFETFKMVLKKKKETRK